MSGEGSHKDLYGAYNTASTGYAHDTGTRYVFATANDANDNYDHDQLVTGGRNRWTHQTFFTEKPTAQNCQDSQCWRVTPVSYELRYDLNYSSNNQAYTTDQENPNANSGDEFNLGIALPFGPLSTGISVGVNSDVIEYNEDPYAETYWWLWADQFPDDQENTKGVEFDMVSSGNTGWFTLGFEDTFQYDIETREGAWGVWNTIYTREPTVNGSYNIEIIS